MAPRGPVREFERLPLWKNAWRLALAWLLGMALFMGYSAPVVMLADTADLPIEDPPNGALIVGLLLLDLVVGHLILTLVAFRRRAPVTIAVVAMVLSMVSVMGAMGALLAALSLATQRRLGPIVWLGILNLGAGLFHENTIARVTVPSEIGQSITGQGRLWDTLVYTEIGRAHV